MSSLEMVPLVRQRPAFEARVLAARLGADGILWQLRGDGLDGICPGGGVDVLVSVDDLPGAQELLLADEVEDALHRGIADLDDEAPGSGRRWGSWMVSASLVLFSGAFLVGRLLTY